MSLGLLIYFIFNQTQHHENKQKDIVKEKTIIPLVDHLKLKEENSIPQHNYKTLK